MKPELDPQPVFETEIDVARDLAKRCNELLAEFQPLATDEITWAHVAAIADAIGHLGAAVNLLAQVCYGHN